MLDLNSTPASGGRETDFHPALRVAEAPPARDRIGEIADWVLANVPWTVPVPDWPCFHDRWPLLSRRDLAAVEAELQRRGAALDAPGADLDAMAARLTGRTTCCAAAADWLTLNPAAAITDPEFVRRFSLLSRAELILAAIENRRRIVERLSGGEPRATR